MGDNSSRNLVRAHAGLFLMAVIWALNFSIIKIGLAQIPPFAFNALRFPLAGVTVLLYIYLTTGKVPLPPRREVPLIVGLGLLGNFLYQLFFITGLNRTSAGNASLLLASTPILTALLSSRVGHERLGARVWSGVVLTFAGIVLVVLGSQRGAFTGAHIGDLVMLAASVAWSVFTVGSRRLVDTYGSTSFTAWTLWSASIALVLAGLPELLRTDFAAVGPAAWWSVAYAGVLGIGIAYMIWYHGVRVIGNTRTSTYSNLVPMLAVLFAWPTLGERPTVWQIAGAVVIVTGVSLARSESGQRPRRPEPFEV